MEEKTKKEKNEKKENKKTKGRTEMQLLFTLGIGMSPTVARTVAPNPANCASANTKP